MSERSEERSRIYINWRWSRPTTWRDWLMAIAFVAVVLALIALAVVVASTILRGRNRRRLGRGSCRGSSSYVFGRLASATSRARYRAQKDRECFEIKDLHATVDGKKILNGLTLSLGEGEVHAHHGPERLGQVDAVLRAGGSRRLRSDVGHRSRSAGKICST